MSNEPLFASQVVAPLRRLGRQLRRRLLVAGLARCAAIVVLLATIQLLIDLVLVLGWGPRAALLVIVVAFIVYEIWQQLVRPAALRIGADEMAAVLERARPDLRDRLVSAVALFSAPARPDRNSPAMVSALVAQTRQAFEGIRPADILNRPRHRRFVALGLGCAIVAVGAYLMSPDFVATYLARDVLLQDAAWPSRTHIRIEGVTRNKIPWPLGDDFTLIATAEGDVPRSLRAEVSLPGGATTHRDMSRRGENQFVLDYGPLGSSIGLRFLIEKFGADEPTIWYEVEAVERPAVREVNMTIRPPEYTKQPPLALPAGQTTAEILRGSSVSIAARVNKKLASAVLRTSGQRVVDAVREPDNRIRADFTPASGGTYFFDLSDTGGLTDLHPVSYVIRLASDPPPKVRLNLPGAGEMLAPTAVVELDIDCEDNLALKNVELLYRVAHEGPATTTQPDLTPENLPGFEAALPHYAVKHSWPISSLSVKPGDQLTMLVRAADFQPSGLIDGRLPVGVAESTTYTLKIVTPEELLAELGRRENEWRREFEQIIKSQEQIKKRIMDIHDGARTGGLSKDGAVAYAREETAQRGQIGRVKTVRRQFEQIMAELKVNQLANPSVRRRLEGGVLDPLAKIINTDAVAAADRLESARREFSRESADQVEQAQTRLIEMMYGILANMLKWEGYNEAVGLLRDVIRLQSDVHRQTQTRLEEQVEGLFGAKTTSRPEDE